MLERRSEFAILRQPNSLSAQSRFFSSQNGSFHLSEVLFISREKQKSNPLWNVDEWWCFTFIRVCLESRSSSTFSCVNWIQFAEGSRFCLWLRRLSVFSYGKQKACDCLIDLNQFKAFNEHAKLTQWEEPCRRSSSWKSFVSNFFSKINLISQALLPVLRPALNFVRLRLIF